eukprot:TRINITY_DN5281_c0_g1_i1.p1 TRINITY_DN5281_c0_g1~~TRINITY_DN5281_c0_g1_i1.p1  ORF type:complete len:551 (-),score=152.80 TRINITY_DN5281_c0_g1_i1:291-1922(-)
MTDNKLETSLDLVNSLMNENENLICGICLDKYLPGQEKISIFPCGHQICVDCSNDILNINKPKYNCPFCMLETDREGIVIVNVDKRLNEAFIELKRKEKSQMNKFEIKLKENNEEKSKLEEERTKIQEELNRLKENLKRKEEEILQHQKDMGNKKLEEKPTSNLTPTKTEKIIKTSKNVLKEYMGQVSSQFWKYAPIATDFFCKPFQRKISRKLERKEEEFIFLERRGISNDSNVWRAISREDGKNEQYAVKKARLENNPQNLRSIFREAMILERLSFYDVPGVVQLSGLLQKNRYTLYIFPLYEFDLEYALGAGLTKGHEHSISLQLVSTVYFIHKEGLAHRDIKPNSVLLNFISNEKGFEVKLGSWGYAGCVKRGNSLLPDLSTGYHRYKSPEFFYKKRNELNYRSVDVWALGTVLAELVLNEPLIDCWRNLELDYLVSIFAWKECLPSQEDQKDLPKLVQKAIEEKSYSKSLRDKLKETIPDSFADYICSFLTFNESREINIDVELFQNYQIPIFDFKDLNDEKIDEWITNHLSKNFISF